MDVSWRPIRLAANAGEKTDDGLTSFLSFTAVYCVYLNLTVEINFTLTDVLGVFWFQADICF